MYQILTLVGIDSTQLKSLTDCLEQHSTILESTPEYVKIRPGGDDYMNWRKVQFPNAELISVQWDPETRLYRVEVRINIRKKVQTRSGHDGEMSVFHVPRDVITALYDALDVYPKEKRLVKIK